MEINDAGISCETRYMKLLLLIFSILLLASVLKLPEPKQNSPVETDSINTKEEDPARPAKIESVENIKRYTRQNGYNSTIYFIADLSIESGKKRFFIYNLDKNKVEHSGLVTHGSGLSSRSGNVNFSNKAGSNCSSPGRYAIGKSYVGKFGLAYKLHGLDKSNSAAYERFVVLHSHNCVPEEEVYPATICESWGCPTVSPGFLAVLKNYIDTSEKKIILEILPNLP